MDLQHYNILTFFLTFLEYNFILELKKIYQCNKTKYIHIKIYSSLKIGSDVVLGVIFRYFTGKQVKKD